MGKHIEWLKDKRKFIYITEIEKELEFKAGTIKHWLAGRRHLTIEQEIKVENYIKEFRK